MKRTRLGLEGIHCLIIKPIVLYLAPTSLNEFIFLTAYVILFAPRDNNIRELARRMRISRNFVL